jgi:hypothetical protein
MTYLNCRGGWVNSADRSRNKKHEAFEPSFEWKECSDEHLVEQKLNYSSESLKEETLRGKKQTEVMAFTRTGRNVSVRLSIVSPLSFSNKVVARRYD